MSENRQYSELAWVPLDEWPLEDSPEGQTQANKLAPDRSQWMRVNGNEPAYVLMRYEGVPE